MRRIGVVLGVAVVMAAAVALTAGAALAQSETETFHIRDMTSFTFENPCTEEEILFEGDFQNVQHITLNEQARNVLSLTTNIDITGTGLETGDKYRFINTGGFQQSGGANGMSVDNNHVILLLVSEGNSPDLILQIVTKVMRDEDGEPFLGFEIITNGCTPEVETTQTRMD
jgi:hypothetical protein